MPPTKFFYLGCHTYIPRYSNISRGADSALILDLLFRFAEQHDIAETAGNFIFDKVILDDPDAQTNTHSKCQSCVYTQAQATSWLLFIRSCRWCVAMTV